MCGVDKLKIGSVKSLSTRPPFISATEKIGTFFCIVSIGKLDCLGLQLSKKPASIIITGLKDLKACKSLEIFIEKGENSDEV